VLEDYNSVKSSCDETQVFFELAEEDDSESTLEEVVVSLQKLKIQVEDLEFRSLLSNKYDTANCFFSLNSGAGGTDAQDWTQMLLRMYMRWFEKNNFTCEIVDQTYGDEAGIKSSTLMVNGDYAYGYLKNEIGVHRLVRLSPFNANNKRQTSFAAVDVIPQVENSAVDIEIDPKDLRIDTFRSSGAGGQHVNKTDSAVRITHLPTGVVAQSQNSRSQLSNKETALSMLKSRLAKLMNEQRKDKIDEIRGEVKDIAWGNQIRSYVFHPYKLIKDLRTGVERTDINSVMDGDLDVFIKANLLKQRGK
jgi:peptide chain release factor 2